MTLLEQELGAAEHSEDLLGRHIEVRKLDGARPWAVFVDGVLVMGNGLRIHRRLAYSTKEAAAAAGRKFVRELEREAKR